MTRMTARQLAFQLLFYMTENRLDPEDAIALFFSEDHYDSLKEEDLIFQEYPDDHQLQYIRNILDLVCGNQPAIDEIIRKYAKGWKLERLSNTSVSILRFAVCEILYVDDVPAAVAVNEAVDLAKRYESPQAASFINGVLGSWLRAENEAEHQEADLSADCT